MVKTSFYSIIGIVVAVLVVSLIVKSLPTNRSNVLRGTKESFASYENLASSNTQINPLANPLGDLQKPGTVVLDETRGIERPYVSGAVNSVDDYEYNLVFQNENSRELVSNKVELAERPFNWTNYPPSASQFTQGQFSSGYLPTQPMNSEAIETYKAIEGASIQPQDMTAIEEEEKKILATYAPKHAGELTTYSVEDARELINRVYEKRGKVAEIVEKPNNVFEIVSARDKNEKIVYEDDNDPSQLLQQTYANPNAFDVISVPQAATDTAAKNDPFYEARTSVRSDRDTYQKWTPGLERMFAPTYEKKNWY